MKTTPNIYLKKIRREHLKNETLITLQGLSEEEASSILKDCISHIDTYGMPEENSIDFEGHKFPLDVWTALKDVIREDLRYGVRRTKKVLTVIFIIQIAIWALIIYALTVLKNGNHPPY